MIAIEFIKEYLKDNPLHSADLAYEIYTTTYPSVDISYPYFRTKYNNEKKSLIVVPTENDEPTLEIKFVEPKIKKRTTRKVHSYSDVTKELPEPPGLMPTGTKFDEFISDRVTTDEELQAYFDSFGKYMDEQNIEIGGFTRKCVDVTAGMPGSGKTTSRCKLAALAKIFARREQGKEIRVGFLSGEMRESEWHKELRKSPLLREVEVEYLTDIAGDEHYEELLWEAISSYDIVITDSFPIIISHIMMNPKEKRNEKTIVRDLIKGFIDTVEKANNNCQLINQCNKDGNYKGGTDLPHMMSSQSFVVVDGQKRYMEFEKNRNNGNVRRKLYFSNDAYGNIVFDADQYDMMYKQKEDAATSLKDLIDELSSRTSNTEELTAIEEEINNDVPDNQRSLLEEIAEFEELEQEQIEE